MDGTEYPEKAAPARRGLKDAWTTLPSAGDVVQDRGQTSRHRPAWLSGLVVGALLLATLGVVGPDVTLQLPSLDSGSSDAWYPGVRARHAATMVQSTRTTPLGELAFLAIEPDGSLVATDRKRKTIHRFDPAGARVAEWGPALKGAAAPLGDPAGIATGHDGSYYVVDRDPPRVLHLDATGNVRQALNLQPFGPYGLNGVALGRDGAVYVADTGRNRILVLTPDGRLQREVGRGAGKDPGQFTQPIQLAFSPEDGALLVSDWENARVQRFAPSPDLVPTDAWPTGYRSFGLALDPRGRVYVANPAQQLIQVFAPRSGVLLGEVGGRGSPAVDVAGLVQVAVSPLSSGAVLYALGPQAIARIELEDTDPPRQPSGGSLALLREVLDPVSLAVVAASALVALLVLDRNRRRQTQRFG